MAYFTVTANNQTVKAEQKDDKNFVAHIGGKTLQLYVKQDDEGANNWFDAATNNETEETKEIGKAIEAYLLNKRR